MSMLSSGDYAAIMKKPIERKPIKAGHGSKIYFILCHATGRVKCGVAFDPRGRLTELQVGSPTALKLIGEIDGDHAKERLLHRRLDQWRVHGEWFHYVPEVFSIIAEEIANYFKDLYHSDRVMMAPPSIPSVVQCKMGDELLHRFLTDCTVSSRGVRTQSSKLYGAFVAWCMSGGAEACSQKAFTMAMTNAGYRRMLSSVVFFLDISLKPK